MLHFKVCLKQINACSIYFSELLRCIRSSNTNGVEWRLASAAVYVQLKYIKREEKKEIKRIK